MWCTEHWPCPTVEVYKEARSDAVAILDSWANDLPVPSERRTAREATDLIRVEPRTEECPYTFAHTKHWCGKDGCRDA